MHVEIVSPEATLYSGEAAAVTVPGVDGQFQMLDNHAPIVALLEEGTVKIKGDIKISKPFVNKFKRGKDNSEMLLHIQSGTVEMNDNKLIVLVE